MSNAGMILVSNESARVMSAVDRMKPKFRTLVHEYGAVIVSRMVAEGYTDPDRLRAELETWRSRRQDEWMSAIPFRKAN
jgi:hypothetical protein